MTTETATTGETTNPESQSLGPRALVGAESPTTSAETNEKTPELRRLRAVITRPLYRRVAVAAARQEVAPNAIVVRALTRYLDQVETENR